MKKPIALALALCLLLMSACGTAPAPAQTPEPTLSLAESVNIATTDSVAQFSSALFEAAAEQENTVLSPLSVYFTLALAMIGADIETQNSLEKTLGGGIDSVLALSKQLMSELQDCAGRTVLTVSNSVWTDESLTLNERYVALVGEYLSAEVFRVDMDTDGTRRQVNAWVSEKTNGLIPALRDKNYGPEELVSLINAVYFNAKWQSPFTGWATREEEFTTASDGTVMCDFMHMGASYMQYIRTDAAEGVLLPYDDGKTAMLVLKPTAGGSPVSLGAVPLSEYIAAAQSTPVILSLPSFTAETSVSLADALGKIGLSDAFENGSYPGMAENVNLPVGSILQKAKIIVDEEGTEAAAVTEMTFGSVATVPDNTVTLRFDSPFFYAVVELEHSLPLFMGTMDNPAA